MKHKRVILFPYSIGSSGAKAVAAHLTTMDVECLRVHSNREYEPKEGDFIVGWGSGNEPAWYPQIDKVKCTYINTPEAICRSVSKIQSFKAFKKAGVPTPKWSLEREDAVEWSKDGKWVCVRQSAEGMDGYGLVLAKKVADVGYAPLYTEFVPNDREFRVYVFDGVVIDTLEKFPDDDATNKHIRTESNHYIYQRVSGVPKAGLDAAIDATAALGLVFSGVDLILGEDKKCYVLETNTAPGIGQITAKRIAQAIRDKAGL